MIEKLNRLYGRLLYALALLACLLLLGLAVAICVDVFLRYVNRSGLTWANEISEYTLHVITFLVAPYLLRQGQHIRVDLLLAVLPSRIAWQIECIGDVSGFAISAILFWIGSIAVKESFLEHSLVIKSLSVPDWWLLTPVPVCMFLLGIEFLFRLYRLLIGPRQMRNDATSAA